MTVHRDGVKTERLPDRGGQVKLSFAEQLRYWRRQLEDVSVLELPIVQSRTNSMTSTTTYEFDVPQDVTTRRTDLSDPWGVSLLDLTVAVFQIVLARYTDRKSVV